MLYGHTSDKCTHPAVPKTSGVQPASKHAKIKSLRSVDSVVGTASATAE